MIRLNDIVGAEGNGLSLHKNTLTIQKSYSDFILIETKVNICIEAGVSAKLLDICEEQNIHIEVKENAKLSYQILNAKNSVRTISCWGEVSIMEIALEESKEELEINLLQEQANATVDLLSIANGASMQFLQRIEHQAKHTSSNISNFGVALQKGSILFDTTGKIRKKMAKSKCVQLSRGIVMDDVSSVTSKPILLIDEYDVIANHGASIGKMSDESLFYLMSRGLTKQEAFLLILEGIVQPFIEKLEDEAIKNQFNEKIKTVIAR